MGSFPEAYNLGQNKMEQQTPMPPKSRMKPREGQKRAIFPSLIWGGMGGGGSRFSIYFVQDCRLILFTTLWNFTFSRLDLCEIRSQG